MRPEDEFQARVIELAQWLNFRVAHFRAARTAKGWRTPVAADGAGFPDLVLVRERVIYAEIKSAHGRLSDDQRAWRDALSDAGQEYYLWRPKDWDTIEATLRQKR